MAEYCTDAGSRARLACSCRHEAPSLPGTGSSYGPGWRQQPGQPQHGRAAGEKPAVRRGAGLTFPCCDRETYGTGSRACLCRAIWAIGPAMSARQSTRETRLAPAAAHTGSRSVPPQPSRPGTHLGAGSLGACWPRPPSGRTAAPPPPGRPRCRCRPRRRPRAPRPAAPGPPA